MPTYRLDLEYEGTRYHGWQEQANARSIAGELRRAIVQAGAEVLELGGSGRTDAGVHALAQTAHLRLRHGVDPEPFRRAVNEALPADIHLLRALFASDAFHARHDAVSRVYLYQISRRRTAHAKRHVYWVKRPLDAAAMAAAAARLEGRHDFGMFCERAADQPGTVVVLEKAEVEASDALVLVRLTASHFLWKMVRRVVGVLVRVAAGDCGVADVDALLEGRLPAGQTEGIARWTAPAAGLFLERVIYPGEPPAGPMAPAIPVASERPPDGAALFTGARGETTRVPPAPVSSTRRGGATGSVAGRRSGARSSPRGRRDRGR